VHPSTIDFELVGEDEVVFLAIEARAGLGRVGCDDVYEFRRLESKKESANVIQ
jgi:hypothetical protein